MISITQNDLYQYNQARIQDSVNHDKNYLLFEDSWITQWLDSFDQGLDMNNYHQFIQRFDQFIADESSEESLSGNYVSEEITKEQFRYMLQEFAVDGLTEAQVFYYAMPRLHLTAQMPMLRIMIDEFGSANPKKMHTALFIELLKELDMPLDQSYYYDRMSNISYEFLNMYFWLALRADNPSYFVGALTYLETIIPVVFPSLVKACGRLNIHAHHYYSEHCHIDEFHALEGKKILRAMWQTETLDLQKAWLGVQLSSAITNRVFENAVDVAKEKSTASKLESVKDGASKESIQEALL